jgi:hypothetical protein
MNANCIQYISESPLYLSVIAARLSRVRLRLLNCEEAYYIGIKLAMFGF